MPVAVLIVLMLGSIALDSAVVFRAQRELQDVASGLANDAASAINIDAFYASEGSPNIVLDTGRIDALIATVLGSRGADPLAVACTHDVDTAAALATVTITCTGSSQTILRRALIGGDRVPIRASATATLREG